MHLNAIDLFLFVVNALHFIDSLVLFCIHYVVSTKFSTMGDQH